MSTYANLQLDHYYLVRENKDEKIILIQAIMETKECFLLLQHTDYDSTFWRKKKDSIAEIIEELTEEQMAEYEDLFEDEEEEDFDMEEEEEEEDWDDDLM